MKSLGHKMSIPVVLLLVNLFLSHNLIGQVSAYKHTEAFKLGFYPYPGSAYRSASGEPGTEYWQNRADYNISCQIDTANHMISATSELYYTNNSPDSLRFLWLQMDQNINKEDSRATSYDNTLSHVDTAFVNPKFTNGYEIKSIYIEIQGRKYIPRQVLSDTRLQVWLQTPLASSGGKLKLIINYAFKVPGNGGVSTRVTHAKTPGGELYQTTHWFPRMCVYDDIQGWNTPPFLGPGEFYLEYGDINYSVTAPANMLVVGSGELINPSQCFSEKELQLYKLAKESEQTVLIRSPYPNNSKINKVWKFQIKNARDAAWAASAAFTLDGAKINLPDGKSCLALSAYAKGAKSVHEVWKHAAQFTKASVEFYSRIWSPYPYPVATAVAGFTGGMEYPGFVICLGVGPTGPGVWSTINHEFAHTWFPMIVGSNERLHGWMDEGLNTFMNDSAAIAFNNKELTLVDTPKPGPVSVDTFAIDGLLAEWNQDPIFNQHDVLGRDVNAVYDKPAFALHQLRNNVLGHERFDAAFREYIRRWSYKHPTPWDFFRTIENVAGEDLAWFWRGYFIHSWKIDIAVKKVSFLKSSSLGTMYNSIQLECLGEMPMPVEVLIKLNDGTSQRVKVPVEAWMRGELHYITILNEKPVTEVRVDPDNLLPDTNRKNNNWKHE
ncbi:hypothetical protein BWD42_07390 [Sphingobacterium sp. CZ-UAM]|nr:hypothetical protein BWD42_07390 [Sphingobacterium sp. CZ-UAM]